MCLQQWDCPQQLGTCSQQCCFIIYHFLMLEIDAKRDSGGNVRNNGGNVCDSGGSVRNSGKIEYGLGNLRVEIVIHNFDKLPFRIHGITCEKPIRI